jgi:hypothetical protein
MKRILRLGLVPLLLCFMPIWLPQVESQALAKSTCDPVGCLTACQTYLCEEPCPFNDGVCFGSVCACDCYAPGWCPS